MHLNFRDFYSMLVYISMVYFKVGEGGYKWVLLPPHGD